MIFAGDVAIADRDLFEFTGFPDALLESPWCFNLEGAIREPGCALPNWGVANCSHSMDSLKRFRLGPLFLGNNHIHDVPNGVSLSHAALAAQGCSVFGVGGDAFSAREHVQLRAGRIAYTLLGFGWPVIGCVPAGSKSAGVNPLEGKHVLASTDAALRANPAARIVVVMHTNYEFEPYLQPGHRKLARELIDIGVYAVVCHHPHIVGPVERYKGRTIAHSLGNWAFSYGQFFGGRLKFPESSFHQIALDLGDGHDRVHHARFEPPLKVRYERSESVEAEDFSLRPAFEGFDNGAYLAWFRANRVKRKGLPIYTDANSSISNWLRDRWVSVRQVLIDTAAKSGLKAMRRRV